MAIPHMRDYTLDVEGKMPFEDFKKNLDDRVKSFNSTIEQTKKVFENIKGGLEGRKEREKANKNLRNAVKRYYHRTVRGVLLILIVTSQVGGSVS